MNSAIPDLYNFLRGPGFVISLIIFFSVSIYRIFQLFSITRKLNMIVPPAEITARTGPAVRHASPLKMAAGTLKIRFRNTVFSTNPVMGIISFVFHILLFITPLFLAAHNTVADLTIGLSLPSVPERLSDCFTIILIIIGIFFLTRRIIIPRVRILTTARDYFVLFIVMAPFITAFFAYHHFFNYRIVIYTHMIIGELALIIVPFTGLIHMPFIVFSRLLIDSEYSITPGNRSW